MIILLVLLGFLCIAGGIALFDSWWGRANRLRIALGILLCALLPISLVVYFLWTNANCSLAEAERFNLYSGFNQSQASGHFILGTGRIDETNYVFYWKDDNGIKTSHQYPLSSSQFIEDGNKYAIVYRTMCKNNLQGMLIEAEEYIEFHIPENSIYNMFDFK